MRYCIFYNHIAPPIFCCIIFLLLSGIELFQYFKYRYYLLRKGGGGGEGSRGVGGQDGGGGGDGDRTGGGVEVTFDLLSSTSSLRGKESKRGEICVCLSYIYSLR